MANSIKLSAAATVVIAMILAAIVYGTTPTHAADNCETDPAAAYLTALGIDAKTSKYDKGAGSPLDYANDGENDESDCAAAETVEPTPAPTPEPTPTPRATPEPRPQTRSAPAPATTPEPGTENTQQQQQQQEDTAVTRASHLLEMSITDATAVEGEDLEFVITFSEHAGPNVSVICTSSIEAGDTAEDNDFTPGSSIVFFQAGDPGGTCTVPTFGHSGSYQYDDTLTVTLSAPMNATIVQATAKGTIVDASAGPQLSFLSGSRQVSENSGTINNFVCIVPSPWFAEGPFDVTLEITGTATRGDDYVNIPTTVTASRAQSQLCVPVTIIEDNLPEIDAFGSDTETIIVRIVSASVDVVRIDRNADTAEIHISDNDGRAAIDSITGGAGYEGGQNDGTSSVAGQQFGNVNFRVRMDGPNGYEQYIDWQIVSGGQAKPGEDVPASGRIIIPPGVTDFYIQLPVIDDNLSEQFGSRNYETFELEIHNASGGITFFENNRATALGTIYDNEARPTVTIENATAVEGEDIVFVINIWPPAGARTPVFFGIDVPGHYPPTDDTATRGVDFLAPHPAGFSILLPYGATTAEVRLGTIDDDLVEGTEEFGIGIHRGGSTITGTPRTATGTILDND